MITEGLTLLVDKPLHWTSFDVVNKLRYSIRKAYGIKKIKVGHAGTLDPLATGLLIICVGKHTKRIESFMGLGKEYSGEISLGATTPSFDRETEIDQTYPVEHITEALVEQTIPTFTGTIWQQPPAYSAIKVDGVRAYKKARAGEAVEIKKREVFIHSLAVKLVDQDVLQFVVECSKGTYIRTLAHDFAQAMHSGGHLKSLRRTKIGTFSVSNAWALEDLIEAIQQNKLGDEVEG